MCNTINNKVKYLLLLLITALSCSAQQDKYDLILKELDKNHRIKLDSGKFMMETERQYALDIDSLMNLIFNELVLTKTTKAKNIEIEQKQWKKNNALKINAIWKPLNDFITEYGFIPNDEKMFAYSQQAELSRKRIFELIKKFNN